MQHPRVESAVAPGFAAVARQPVERAVLYEAAFDWRIQRGFEGESDGPGRLHFHPGSDAGKFRRGGQQRGGLRCRCGDHHMAVGAVGATVGVLQMPVLFAAIDLGDAAGKLHVQAIEQAAGDGAHARRADPAGLLVRRHVQLAALEGVQLRRPLGGPALALPALHFGDEAPVTRGEVLSAQVQRAGVAALARHAPAAAAAFIEQLNGMPGLCQSLSGGEPGDAGADDCDRYSHRGLVYLSVQTTPSIKPVQFCFLV